MSEIIEYNVTLPIAARLAGLAGIKADLDRVVAYCDRMIERWSGPHLAETPFDIVGFSTALDFDDWEALSTATAIAYGRCFATGVRVRLTSEEPSLPDHDSIELHRFLIDFRNKHVAHSVNAFEQNNVGVQIGSDFVSSAEIDSIVPRHSRQSGFQIDQPAKVRRLTEWWHERVREEMEDERLKVLQEVRKTPLEDIRKMGTIAPGSRDVSARRQSF